MYKIVHRAEKLKVVVDTLSRHEHTSSLVDDNLLQLLSSLTINFIDQIKSSAMSSATYKHTWTAMLLDPIYLSNYSIR